MLRPRIIPCLLVKGQGLVKTIKFKDPTYVGDPINAVRIFNEKEVDELIVLDIEASLKKHEPNYKLIEGFAAECRMPLCYGGGVKTLDQIQRIIGLGVEKVALGAAAIENHALVEQAAGIVGSQSIVVVLDIKKHGSRYEVFINSGRKKVDGTMLEHVRTLVALGVGEIVINSIDNDGTMKGYDYEMVQMVQNEISIPLTVLGGAGKLDDIQQLFRGFGLIGAAAGSLFTFRGQYRAVLINYPSRQEKEGLLPNNSTMTSLLREGIS